MLLLRQELLDLGILVCKVILKLFNANLLPGDLLTRFEKLVLQQLHLSKCIRVVLDNLVLARILRLLDDEIQLLVQVLHLCISLQQLLFQKARVPDTRVTQVGGQVATMEQKLDLADSDFSNFFK